MVAVQEITPNGLTISFQHQKLLLLIIIKACWLSLEKKDASFIYGNLVNFKHKKKFDIIFCLFHVINYVSSKKDLKIFLNAHQLLNDGGFLV